MVRPIRLGHIDLSFHAASAAVVQVILEDAGHQVIVSASPHERMFGRFGSDEVDLLVSAWLPASHQAFLTPHAKQTRKLGILYQPYCIWGVPDYVPEEAVSEVADLLRPEVLTRMRRSIEGIHPGAGISRFSASMISAYRLGDAGYWFQSGSEEECFGGFEKAVAEKRWVVVPLWHPQYLHYTHRIRALREPLGLLGGQDEATLIIREAATALLSSETLGKLRRLSLGNDVVTMLDHRVRKEGIAAVDAARTWLTPPVVP
jgi:glycine betaine/proline transport system substrate-binding protein